MAPRKKTTTGDSLSTFTQSTAQAILGGSTMGYVDSPFGSAYAKDATALAGFYESSWICRAAVDGIPDDCFKKAYQWVADAAQITAIENLEKRHKVKQKKRQALAWSRLDGEAYIYIDTGQNAASELLPDRIGKDGLKFLNVMRMRNVQKGQLIQDPMSQYYGEPEYYQVNSASSTQKIHPSRMARFISSPSPVDGAGKSVLTYLLQPIIAAETARDNTVALTTEALIDVMKVCGLMESVSDPIQEAAMVKRYALARQMKATNRMMVIDMDKEDFDRKPSTFTTLPDVIETMRREAAAAIGIPYALLFGSPAGLGANGETEIKNYYDNIATIQRNEIQPICENIDECVIRSALGSRPEEIYLDWLSLYETSDREKADISLVMANAAKTAIESGVMVADFLTEPLINSWVEIGSFQGIEQSYQDWLAGGGVLEDPADETDAVGGLPGDGESGNVTP